MAREFDAPPVATAAAAAASPEARLNRVDVLLLIALVVFAAIFRCLHVDAAPSLDEFWHLDLSRGNGSPMGSFAADTAYPNAPPLQTLDGAAPAWHVWNHMDGVLHPPLYILALRSWRDVFGPSFAAAHAYSILLSLASVALVFDIGRRHLGRAAGTWAAIWMIVAPMQVHFAQEIRGYEQLILLGTLALWLASRIEVEGATPRRAGLLAAVSLPMLLTHYFAAGALVGLAIWALRNFPSRGRRTFVGVGLAMAAIYAVVWLPFALRQLRDIGAGDAFLNVREFDPGFEVPWVVSLPARLFLERPLLSSRIGTNVALVIGGTLWLVPFFLRRRQRIVGLWMLWLAAAVGSLVLLDVIRSTKHAAVIRYAAIASPAAFLLAAAVARRLGPIALHAGGAGCAIALALSFVPGGTVIYDSPDFRPITSWLAARLGEKDGVIVVETSFDRYTYEMLMTSIANEPGVLPRAVAKIEAGMPAEEWRKMPDSAWVVVLDDDLARLHSVMGAAIAGETVKVDGVATFVHADLRGLKAGTGATRPATQPVG